MKEKIYDDLVKLLKKVNNNSTLIHNGKTFVKDIQRLILKHYRSRDVAKELRNILKKPELVSSKNTKLKLYPPKRDKHRKDEIISDNIVATEILEKDVIKIMTFLDNNNIPYTEDNYIDVYLKCIEDSKINTEEE